MKKVWFVIAGVDDGSYKAIKNRIDDLGSDISDYEVSKIFLVEGIRVRSITFVCDVNTYKRVTNINNYDTVELVPKIRA